MSNSNNNYLNGNIKRSRDYTSNLTPSSSSTYSSKYRTDRTGLTNGSTPTRSKYSSEREEAPKIGERIRNFQSSKSVVDPPTFKSRFLRSSQPSETAKTERPDENASEEVRPSVSDLRRRYDQNRNHVTPERSRTPVASTVSIKPPSGSKSSRTTAGNTDYGSDSDESVERDGRSTPVNQRLASIAPTVRLQSNSPTPDRVINGDRASPARPSVPKDIPRSTSPSTLSSSSSSDGDNQVILLNILANRWLCFYFESRGSIGLTRGFSVNQIWLAFLAARYRFYFKIKTTLDRAGWHRPGQDASKDFHLSSNVIPT